MKKLYKNIYLTTVLSVTLLMWGCATAHKALEVKTPPAQLRAMQTRSFDTADKEIIMRAVVGTMQDLQFAITEAYQKMGVVTGTKYFRGQSVVKMTVTVKSDGKKRILVRTNVRCGIDSIEAPVIYRDFFASLSKSIFLTANRVD
jgi:hypothetical protein